MLSPPAKMQKTLENQKLNLSRCALFYMKTGVNPKYPVSCCSRSLPPHLIAPLPIPPTTFPRRGRDSRHKSSTYFLGLITLTQNSKPSPCWNNRFTLFWMLSWHCPHQSPFTTSIHFAFHFCIRINFGGLLFFQEVLFGKLISMPLSEQWVFPL